MIKLKPTSGKFDFLSLPQLTTVMWKLKLKINHCHYRITSRIRAHRADSPCWCHGLNSAHKYVRVLGHHQHRISQGQHGAIIRCPSSDWNVTGHFTRTWACPSFKSIYVIHGKGPHSLRERGVVWQVWTAPCQRDIPIKGPLVLKVERDEALE